MKQKKKTGSDSQPRLSRLAGCCSSGSFRTTCYFHSERRAENVDEGLLSVRILTLDAEGAQSSAIYSKYRTKRGSSRTSKLPNKYKQQADVPHVVLCVFHVIAFKPKRGRHEEAFLTYHQIRILFMRRDSLKQSYCKQDDHWGKEMYRCYYMIIAFLFCWGKLIKCG